MKAFHTLGSHKSLLSFAASSLLAVTAAAAQVAGSAPGTAPGTAGIDDSGNFRSEVQACKSGQTQQDLDTCLREARNAQAARKSGGLVHPHEDYQANALARCDVFQGSEDKAACEARVMGYGSASGSVAGGGVLHQVETVVVPPGQEEVTIEPKTSDPVVLVPATPAPGSSQ